MVRAYSSEGAIITNCNVGRDVIESARLSVGKDCSPVGSGVTSHGFGSQFEPGVGDGCVVFEDIGLGGGASGELKMIGSEAVPR
jgi:hypothetical protein